MAFLFLFLFYFRMFIYIQRSIMILLFCMYIMYNYIFFYEIDGWWAWGHVCVNNLRLDLFWEGHLHKGNYADFFI